MSDDHVLPADPRLWPDDPYRVLGAPHNADRNQLKRAYHRLLKRYKPEHEPESFRRLREAYDSALARAEFYEQYGSGDDEEEVATTANSQATDTPDAAGVARPIPHDDPQSIWEQSIAGDLTALYHRLRELRLRQPTPPLVYCQLYWLLRLKPDLDRLHTALDWLVEGLCQVQGDAGPLSELYRRHLAVDSEESLSARVQRLLDEQPAAPWLESLIEPRWQSARERNAWMVIQGDLAQLLAATPIDDDTRRWRLMSLAAQQLAPMGDVNAAARAKSLLRELEDYYGTNPRYYDALARLDIQISLLNELERAAKLPVDDAGWLLLIQYRQHVPTHALRRELLELLAKTSPQQMFQYLNALRLGSLGLVMQEISEVIDYAEMYGPDLEETTWPGALVERLMQDFVDGNYRLEDRQFRQRLLEMCLAQALSPRQIVAALSPARHGIWGASDRDLPSRIDADVPLHLTYRAFRLLRG